MKPLNSSFDKKKIHFFGDRVSQNELEAADFLVPDYKGRCLSNLVPYLLTHIISAGYNGRGQAANDAYSSFLNSHSQNGAFYFPDHEGRLDSFSEYIQPSRQYVLLVLDGLGYCQLISRLKMAPALSSMTRSVISSVAPTTTSTVLSSITTGLVPSEHGVMGYRVSVLDGDILNILKWTSRDRRDLHGIDPAVFQSHPSFLGYQAPVLSRHEFAGTGFSRLHLNGSDMHGWRVPSSMLTDAANLMSAGEKFIYLYYDGIDKVAHEYGLGQHYEQELKCVDHLVASLLEALPKGVTLVITADHGQVEVRKPPLELPADALNLTKSFSGEGRFRWLHVKDGKDDLVKEICTEAFSDMAVVAGAEELIDMGLFGGPLSDEYRARIGDVALIATEPVAFFDPHDTGDLRLVSRHGAMTGAEVLVPLLTYTAS